MSAATANQNQRELVRLLYLEHGHQKASELSGVRYDLVRQWASRYGWTQPCHNVTNAVAIAADNVQSELAEHERETRLSLARYARRASRDAEQASLRDAPYVKAVAEVTSKVHRWDAEKTGATFTLNVLNINALDEDSA